MAESGGVELQSEFKYAQEQGFFDKSSVIRYVIFLIFTLCLFLFLHFQEVRVEQLELGSVAERYIVAQVDFEFLDEEMTILHKQEAVRDIGKIYAIVESDVRQARIDFENTLIRNQSWRKQTEHSTFDELYRAIDLIENVLVKMRFTDPRTLQKMKSLQLSTVNYQIFVPQDPQTAINFPAQIWEQVKSTAFSDSNLQNDTGDYVASFFQVRAWKLDEDALTQRGLRKIVQAHVPDRYSKVAAGSRIINQGEKVTMRHIAMLQAMKRVMSDMRNLWHPITLLGTLALTSLLIGILYAYLRNYHPFILASNRKLFLVVSVILLTMLMAKLMEYLLLNTKSNFVDLIRYPVFIPFAAILLCSLISSQIALFGSGFLAIVFTMGLAMEHQGFLLINFLASIVAIMNTRALRQRKEVFSICAKTWMVCVGLVLALHLYDGSLTNLSLFGDLATTFFSILITSIIVVGLLPLFETAFRIMTDVTLMEYMDPNNEILRRLSMEAPGTYQHSVVVGNLAEAAALAIGANGLFCRVASLYHDIGKLATPHFFTENQQGGMNMHQLLTPLESAQVIIAHVSEGVATARKIGLPEQFIDIIKEHHGTTLVYYFYHRQLELSGDASQVKEEEFRYAGPKPRSKESAICMIADSLEAASRSLDELNEAALGELVDRLVSDKAEDGQFSDCALTFRELGIVKKSMVTTIMAAGHSRIKYPKRWEPAQKERVLSDISKKLPLASKPIPYVVEVGVREEMLAALKKSIEARKLALEQAQKERLALKAEEGDKELPVEGFPKKVEKMRDYLGEKGVKESREDPDDKRAKK